jgi:hypothetical protein
MALHIDLNTNLLTLTPYSELRLALLRVELIHFDNVGFGMPLVSREAYTPDEFDIVVCDRLTSLLSMGNTILSSSIVEYRTIDIDMLAGTTLVRFLCFVHE